MCGLRSDVETRSLVQLVRELFRRGSSRRLAAEVIPLPETASARPMPAEDAKEKSHAEAA